MYGGEEWINYQNYKKSRPKPKLSKEHQEQQLTLSNRETSAPRQKPLYRDSKCTVTSGPLWQHSFNETDLKTILSFPSRETHLNGGRPEIVNIILDVLINIKNIFKKFRRFRCSYNYCPYVFNLLIVTIANWRRINQLIPSTFIQTLHTF